MATKIVAPTLIFLLAVAMVGCQTTDPYEGALPFSAGVGPAAASGRTSSEVTTNEIPAAPAIAWGASEATSTAATAKYSPTNSNANSGPVVTGFQLGAIAEQKQKARAWVAARIDADVELRSIRDEIKYLMEVEEYTPELTARLDSLRKQASERMGAMIVGMKEAGLSADLNMGALTHLTVVAWISSNSGATERTPTGEEVAALKTMLADIVSAARGEETIEPKTTE